MSNHDCLLFVSADSPPGPPHSFEIIVRGPEVLSFAWGPPGGEGLTDPRIVYHLSCNPQSVELPRWLANQSLTEHVRITVQKLQPNTSYTCKLCAYNAAGSGPETTAVATTLGAYHRNNIHAGLVPLTVVTLMQLTVPFIAIQLFIMYYVGCFMLHYIASRKKYYCSPNIYS